MEDSSFDRIKCFHCDHLLRLKFSMKMYQNHFDMKVTDAFSAKIEESELGVIIMVTINKNYVIRGLVVMNIQK